MRVLLTSVGVAALCASSSAFAQTTPEADPTATPAENGGGLEEIVVTAQRREQRLQNVPVAVTALTASTLSAQGVNRAFDLPAAVPGLSINRSGQTVVYFLRGVGNGTIVPGSDPSVASYVDGVYQSFPNGAMLALNNVERVEVLRGPQGTLFGRNATGGLIQVVTKTPTNDPHVDLTLGYGRFDTKTASAYVSGGIGIVAADLAVSFTDQSKGWGKNLFTPAQAGVVTVSGVRVNVPDVPTHEAGVNRDFAIASKFVIRPSDELTIKLAGSYAYNKSDQGVYATYAPGSQALITQTGQTVPYTAQGGFWDWNSNARTIQENKQIQVSGDVTYEGDAFTVHSITAYIDALNVPFIYSAAQPMVENPGGGQFASARTPVKTFSQELQLLSPKGSTLDWIVGAYFATNRTGYKDLPFYRGQFIEAISMRTAPNATDTYAAFAQATVPLGEATKLTGGIRFTHDKLSSSQYYTGLQVSTGASPANQFGVISSRVPTQTVSYDNVSWRASIDHHFTDDIMAYASFNTGYKAGGYNTGGLCTTTVNVIPDCPAANYAPPVNPEKLTAYEIGLKSELFDRMVRLNLAAFYYDYRDLQVQSLAAAGPGGGLIAILNNAAKARIKGLDAELTVAPTRNLTFNGAFEILDAKFKDFPNFVPSLPRTVAPFGNANGAPINAAGNYLTRAPKFSGNVGATLTIPTADGEVRANVNYAYNSGIFWDANNRLKQRAYGLLNAELGYTLQENYTIKIWGRNIANTKYWSFADATAFGDRVRAAAPATYGVSLNYKM